MVLLTHIIIALSSLVVSTYCLFSPTQTKLKYSYGLVAATLASGTYLVVISHAAILSSCITGLLYTGVVLGLIMSARHKLAKSSVRIKD